MTKKINVHTEYNESVKQGNFTVKINTVLSKLVTNPILNEKLRNLLIQIINSLNILNLHKSDATINNKIKIISTTTNYQLLESELIGLEILLEDKLTPKNDFINTCQDKSSTKESTRKKVLIDYTRNQYENASRNNLDTKNSLFELIGKIESTSNCEYIHNFFASTNSDDEKLEFLLQQEKYIGKTTKSKTLGSYIGSRSGVSNQIQTTTTKFLNNHNITNIVVLFNGMGGEFSSVVPLLNNYEIKRIVLNDINPTTQNLHITVQKNPLGLKNSVIEIMDYIVEKYGSINLPKEKFKVVFKDLLQQLNELESKKIYDEKTAGLLMILLNWSFSGNYKLENGLSVISTGCCMNKYNSHKLLNKIDLYHYLYNKYPVTFTIDDYKNIVEKEDSKTTLFFNDSPFMVESSSKEITEKDNKSTDTTYGFKDFKHSENLEVMEKIQGSFIYFNYTNPHIINWVEKNNFNIKKINKIIMNTNLKKGGKRTTKTEVIVYSII